MSSISKKSKSVLGELKSLVDSLTDRDVKIKREFTLFEDFFEHFPVPVSMWSANKDGGIVSVRDKGFFCKDASDVHGLFECPDTSTCILGDHEQAILGKNTQRIVEKEDKTYFVSIVSRKDEKEAIIGASGIAWDVSSNMSILVTLKDMKKSLESKSVNLEEISKKIDHAIGESRLNKLLGEDE